MYDYFQLLRIHSLISKDEKENIICTKDECGEQQWYACLMEVKEVALGFGPD